MSDVTRISRVQEWREDLAAGFVQAAAVVADNPGQTAMLLAGTVVVTRAAVNLVRPRTPFQALCLMLVLNVGITKAAVIAAERGVMTWYTRDENGDRIPIFSGKDA